MSCPSTAFQAHKCRFAPEFKHAMVTGDCIALNHELAGLQSKPYQTLHILLSTDSPCSTTATQNVSVQIVVLDIYKSA